MTDERAPSEAMIKSMANDDLTFRFNAIYRDTMEYVKKLKAENAELKNRIKDMEQRTSIEDRIARIEESIRELKAQIQSLQLMPSIPYYPVTPVTPVPPIITCDSSSGHFNGEYHGEEPITDDYSDGGF